MDVTKMLVSCFLLNIIIKIHPGTVQDTPCPTIEAVADQTSIVPPISRSNVRTDSEMLTQHSENHNPASAPKDSNAMFAEMSGQGGRDIDTSSSSVRPYPKDHTATAKSSLYQTYGQPNEEMLSIATSNLRPLHIHPTKSTVFEVSHFAQPDPDCRHSYQFQTKLKDTIVWTSNLDDRHSQEHTWCIIVPEDYGIVLEFHKVDMMGIDFLEILRESNTAIIWRNFTQISEVSLILFQPEMSFAPLLVNERRIIVRAHIFNDNTRRQISRFNLTYTAHLNNSIPSFTRVLDENFTESDVIYDCSRLAQLPKAIMCDGIRHCENGEDETNCSFSQAGCGDWVPYGDQCLKVMFARLLRHKPGSTHVTMPLQAEQSCMEQFGGTLALLPDKAGIKIVTDMILHSGFSNAVVGIRKVQPVSRRLRHLYRFLWQWGRRGSPIAYDQVSLQRSGWSHDCAMLVALPLPYLKPMQCVLPVPPSQGYVCMRASISRRTATKLPQPAFHFQKPSVVLDQFPTKECPDHSLVQTFHRCQWGREAIDEGGGWSPSNLPLFKCQSGDVIHYALVCDGKHDCNDHSDENDCRHPQHSALLESSFICLNGQAISADSRCDGRVDCFDESDEESCVSCGSQIMCGRVGCIPRSYQGYFRKHCPSQRPSRNDLHPVKNPGSVLLDGFGMSRLGSAENCGLGFYACHGGYCIPSYLLNNGEQDCPHGEDEDIPANSMSCPGYYRCQDTGTCVHRDYVCDGIHHCPNKDDEAFCFEVCPNEQGCACEGQAYTCSEMIDPRQHLHVRYLDFSHASGVSLVHIHFMEYLFFLNLSFCELSDVNLTNMPQLQSLDLSFNLLFEFTDINLRNLSALIFLDLSNNPFVKTKSAALSNILKWGKFLSLETLIIANVSLVSLDDNVFVSVLKLRTLDMRRNTILTYGKESLKGPTELDVLYTDETKLCCSYFHNSLSHCFAPVDELSSCSDLLAMDFFRVFLWIIALLAIVGNVGVLACRFCVNTESSTPSFGALVKNLCASDLLMGVYMMMIGVADALFRGNYVANEREWTQSAACTVAGFLSFVSSEVSTLVICLITLDRVLVICFPLMSRFHLSYSATICACCAIWVLSITLAVVPLAVGMDFYGQSSICLPLPITRQQFSGQSYAFGVFIVFNFIIFLLIGVGQLLIYHAIRSTSARAGASERREQNATINRRLFLVVFTDFCCWFPIGLVGLLAFHGIPVPSIVNVWAAIFVLPINSALNPFLYTLDHWRQRQNNDQKTACTRNDMTREAPRETTLLGHRQSCLSA